MPYQWGDTIWDVPNAMCAAAFTGIALFLSLELIVRMAFSWTRHSELYFWSCFVSSWAILLHTITILLFDYGSWQNYSAVVLIHITWCTFVVLQSVVLLSRLSLITKSETTKRWIRYMIVFTGVGFGATTVIFGIVARHPHHIDNEGLQRSYFLWDRAEVVAFFVQETLISFLYIRATASHLKNMTLLGRDPQTTRKAIRNLLFINVYIIALDCTLIGLCYSAHFLLQGFYKPAVYAIKLRTEFSILNQLRASLMGSQDYGSGNSVRRESAPRPIQFSATRASRCFGSDDCDLETDKTGDTKEIKPGVIYKTTTTTVKTSEDGSRHVMVQTVVE